MRSISVMSTPRPMMVDTRLPQPNGSFEWVQAQRRPALVCRALEPSAPHLFTTRAWTLGSRLAEEPAGAWDEVAQAMRIDGGRLVRAHQVHGAAVVVADATRATSVERADA